MPRADGRAPVQSPPPPLPPLPHAHTHHRPHKQTKHRRAHHPYAHARARTRTRTHAHAHARTPQKPNGLPHTQVLATLGWVDCPLYTTGLRPILGALAAQERRDHAAYAARHGGDDDGGGGGGGDGGDGGGGRGRGKQWRRPVVCGLRAVQFWAAALVTGLFAVGQRHAFSIAVGSGTQARGARRVCRHSAVRRGGWRAKSVGRGRGGGWGVSSFTRSAGPGIRRGASALDHSMVD
jgi:hypothetical protein